jgi:uncharacterized NAD(P)/FAD-binding protein YdhS
LSIAGSVEKQSQQALMLKPTLGRMTKRQNVVEHLKMLRSAGVVNHNAFTEDDEWVTNPQVRDVTCQSLINACKTGGGNVTNSTV